MKKTLVSVLSLCLIAVLALGLIGCGKKEEPIESQKETTAAVESKTEKETTKPAESKTEKATEAKTEEAEPEGDNLPNRDQLTEITVDAIYAYNELGRLTSGAIETDMAYFYEDPNTSYLYHLVVDPKYQDYGDISNFANSYFTYDFIHQNYAYLAEDGSYTGQPPFVWLSEGIAPGYYMIDGAKGYTVFDPYADFVFTSVHDDYFCVSFDFDNFGTYTTATIEMVKEDTTWKINSVTK